MISVDAYLFFFFFVMYRLGLLAVTWIRQATKTDM